MKDRGKLYSYHLSQKKKIYPREFPHNSTTRTVSFANTKPVTHNSTLRWYGPFKLSASIPFLFFSTP